MKEIVFNIFDPSGIDRAISAIERLQEKLEKLDNFHERLAQLGVKVAQDAFNSVAMLDSDYLDISVTYNLTENGFEIIAQGEKVAYAEFGAGVYYNGYSKYGDAQISRPSDIDPIGAHDTITGSNTSKGLRRAWGYYTDNENKTGLVITHGTPAVQGMYLADKAIQEEVEKIFREVLA